MADELARIAYESSLRRLKRQQQWLGEIRSSTGLLFAASSVAVSFLGRPALAADLLVLPLLAIVAFTINISASLYVLVPKRDLVFALVGSSVYETLYDVRDDVAEVQRRLAYEVDRFWEANGHTLERVLWGFRIAASALGIEVVLLLLASLGGSVG